MRGKQLRPVFVGGVRGITPAGAGKTRVPRACDVQGRDHPRRCGENVFRKVKKLVRTGSPPQVRGKLILVPPFFKLDRITPAGAGKTLGFAPLAGGIPDHPRRCGENPLTKPLTFLSRGSPPQVRGKPSRYFMLFAFLGITPAGAGKTLLTDRYADEH